MSVLLFNFLSQFVLRQCERLFHPGESIHCPQDGCKNAHGFFLLSFPRSNAQPAFFIFVALNLTKSCLLQICLQGSIRVDGHTINDLRPFVVFCCFSICFVTDEKSPAGFQHPIDFSEIPCKLRPKIDRFKGGHYLKLLHFKRQLCHTCLLHGAPSCHNGTCIDLSRFFYADSRVVDALHLAFGAQF